MSGGNKNTKGKQSADAGTSLNDDERPRQPFGSFCDCLDNSCSRPHPTSRIVSEPPPDRSNYVFKSSSMMFCPTCGTLLGLEAPSLETLENGLSTSRLFCRNCPYGGNVNGKGKQGESSNAANDNKRSSGYVGGYCDCLGGVCSLHSSAALAAASEPPRPREPPADFNRSSSMMFCPTCGTLLLFEAPNLENGLSISRFFCRNCPYVCNVTRKIRFG
ncbi:hypothetical protein KSS87_023481 [Heliosperma pusillum]|nr:hypothetical protein KSS87_023481 [Heliosperma pusillum]